jgi:hypothetical protein
LARRIKQSVGLPLFHPTASKTRKKIQSAPRFDSKTIFDDRTIIIMDGIQLLLLLAADAGAFETSAISIHHGIDY